MQFFLQLLGASLALAQLNGIALRDMMEEMEHLLVDNGGMNSNGFVVGMAPCSSDSPGSANMSRQSSPEVVRLVFHDFITANLVAGTGGLDASIAYESERFDNPGSFVNNSLNYFNPTVSAYMSMSDNIALGLAVAIAGCGGSKTAIPLRVGRIDATSAGPTGVPGPVTDITTTLDQFASAGFSQSDTITATACGHSLGEIHSGNVAGIIDNNTTPIPGNSIPFDTTPTKFDSTVVNQYLSGSGQAGGPLVTTSNIAARSDLRIYISDKNATMQKLSQESAYQVSCNTIFQRMIDTVPKRVALSSVVTPLPWKAVNLQMDLSPSGDVTISGFIRNLATTTNASPPTTVPFITAGNATQQFSHTASGTGTSMYGATTYYPFTSTLTPGSSSLAFGGVSYPINDQIFILPTKSYITGASKDITMSAAALTTMKGDMNAVFYVPTAVSGTASNAIVNGTITMKASGTAGKYTIYTATKRVSNLKGVIAKVVMNQGVASSATIKTELFVNGGGMR